MSNIYEYLFNTSLEEIAARFNSSNADEQEKMVIQLDAIAAKLTPIETHRQQERVLGDIQEAMQGDRARVFFAHSYVSWYRQNKEMAPQLHHWSQLDRKNRRLFVEMLGLRDLGHFDDEALFQFEQYCLSTIDN